MPDDRPRARLRLADPICLGGERPLNLARLLGERVRLVLADPIAAWAEGWAPTVDEACAFALEGHAV